MDLLIQKDVFEMRGTRVMLDKHLAALYEVEIETFIQTVQSNIGKFPASSVFQLNESELEVLGPESKQSLTGTLPFVFTKAGVTTLLYLNIF